MDCCLITQSLSLKKCFSAKVRKTILGTLTGLLSLSSSLVNAQQAPQIKIYAEKPDAHSGKCIKAPDAHSSLILNRNGIQVSGDHNEKDLNALARGLAQLERIHGGPIPETWRTPFKFSDQAGGWAQRWDSIYVNKKTYGGDNVAALMHELGHKIGNADGMKLFSEYLKNAQDCGITPYAKSRRGQFPRGEEFAEVFSAFITNPDDLEKECPSAFSAMKKIFNVKEDSQLASCSKPAGNSPIKGVGPETSL